MAPQRTLLPRVRWPFLLLGGVAAAAACSGDQAQAAGFAAGRGLLIGVVTFVIVFTFVLLSLKYGSALRRKRKLGAWLAGGGHALAILCGVLVVIGGDIPILRVALAILGGALLVLGHVGLWIVVLGLRPGKSKLTFDAGVERAESPGTHALAQGTVILLGLLVLLGGLVFFVIQAVGGK